MESIINYYKKYENIINIFLLILFTTICGLYFKGHYSNILTDFGREMLLPEAILKGNVLYKDILCIYFPLAFQINSIAYKILGINISTLEFCGIINLIIYTITIYLISNEFFDKKFSLLYATTINLATGYNGTLFNFILPYSYSLTYGITSILLSVLFIIKYVKDNTDNRFLILSSFFTGLAFACKGEFLTQLLVILTLLIINKKNIKTYLYSMISFLITPFVSLSVLILQGLNFKDFIQSFNFMKTFFSTDSMLYHIGRTGGIFTTNNISQYIDGATNFLIFFGIIFGLYYLLSQKNKEKMIYLLPFLGAYLLNSTKLWLHTILLPITIVVLAITNFKKIKNNQGLLLLILSSVAITLRMFWGLIISTYGIYTLALPLITLFVLLNTILDEEKATKINLKRFFAIFLSCYLIFYGFYNVFQREANNTLVKTEKGKIYLPEKEATALNKAISFCEKNQNKKVLFLPEGTFINFLTNTNVDLKMHMVDRLYCEAIGEKQIVENLKNYNYNIIFIADGFGLTNFGKPYLYGSKNEILEYIFNNYNLAWTEKFEKKNKTNYLYCLVKK